ncbi:MAG: hypothetical protein HYZ29_11055 [Myxococcales bacterium]|nr:hypothetical protein [Myxococcales bacterium]
MSRRLGWGAVLVVLAACVGQPSGRRPSSPPAAPAPPPPAAAPPTGPTPPAAPNREAQKTRFGPYARVDLGPWRKPIELYRLGSELVVDTGGGLFFTRNGVLVNDPKLQRELPAFYGVTGLAGSFPDDAWVSAIVGTASSGEGTIFRLASHWKRHGKPLPEGWTYVGLADLGEGRRVALAVNYQHGPYIQGPYFHHISGKATKLPSLTAVKPPVVGCTTRIQPASFVGFPSGRLVVYGALCETDEPAVEVFEPGATPSTITVIDSFKGAPCAKSGTDCGRGDPLVEVTSESDIWLVQTDRIVRFDGKTWKPVQPPATKQPIVALSASGDDVWLVAAKGDQEVGELWHRSGSAPWTREVLPPLPHASDHNHGATDVVATEKAVWVAADQHVLRRDYAGEVTEIAARISE